MNKLFFLLLSCIVIQGSVNAMEQFPLHDAARDGNIELVNALLLSDDSANINLQDNGGRAPLFWATDMGHETIVQLLLDKGANINLQDHANQTTLHWATSNGHEAIVRLLLASGAYINLQDNYGWTPLHAATFNGHEAIVRLLLASGAYINLQDIDCNTPMQMAANNHHQGVVQIIKEHIKTQALALAMGLHPHLGENSPVNLQGIDTSILKNIFENLNQ